MLPTLLMLKVAVPLMLSPFSRQQLCESEAGNGQESLEETPCPWKPLIIMSSLSLGPFPRELRKPLSTLRSLNRPACVAPNSFIYNISQNFYLAWIWDTRTKTGEWMCHHCGPECLLSLAFLKGGPKLCPCKEEIPGSNLATHHLRAPS